MNSWRHSKIVYLSLVRENISVQFYVTAIVYATEKNLPFLYVNNTLQLKRNKV